MTDEHAPNFSALGAREAPDVEQELMRFLPGLEPDDGSDVTVKVTVESPAGNEVTDLRASTFGKGFKRALRKRS